MQVMIQSNWNNAGTRNNDMVMQTKHTNLFVALISTVGE